MLATTIQITNNPPHTTHTNNTTIISWLCGQPPPQRVADAHTVLNVNPTVCLLVKLLMPNPKNAPTPTTHCRAVNTCRHKKTTNTTQQAALLVPHKLGSLERR